MNKDKIQALREDYVNTLVHAGIKSKENYVIAELVALQVRLKQTMNAFEILTKVKDTSTQAGVPPGVFGNFDLEINKSKFEELSNTIRTLNVALELKGHDFLRQVGNISDDKRFDMYSYNTRITGFDAVGEENYQGNPEDSDFEIVLDAVSKLNEARVHILDPVYTPVEVTELKKIHEELYPKIQIPILSLALFQSFKVQSSKPDEIEAYLGLITGLCQNGLAEPFLVEVGTSLSKILGDKYNIEDVEAVNAELIKSIESWQKVFNSIFRTYCAKLLVKVGEVGSVKEAEEMLS